MQSPIIQHTTDTGWSYLTADETLELRGSENRLLFRQLFMDQMQRLNPNFMTADLLRQLERIPIRVECNQIIWQYLNGLRTAFVPAEKRERNGCPLLFVETKAARNLERMGPMRSIRFCAAIASALSCWPSCKSTR